MQKPTAQTPPDAISRKYIGCLSPERRTSANNQQILQHTNEFLTWLGSDEQEQLREQFLTKKLIVPPGDSSSVEDTDFKNLIASKVADPNKYPIPTQELACALDAAFTVNPNESIDHMSLANRLLSEEEQELHKVSQLSTEELKGRVGGLFGGKKRTRKKRRKKKRKTKRKKRTKKKTRKKRKSKQKKRTKKKTLRKRK